MTDSSSGDADDCCDLGSLGALGFVCLFLALLSSLVSTVGWYAFGLASSVSIGSTTIAAPIGAPFTLVTLAFGTGLVLLAIVRADADRPNVEG